MNRLRLIRQDIFVLLCCSLVILCWSGKGTGAQTGGQDEWVTRRFEGFARGTFGNAGQNLYVSHAGILQRIHQFDLNHDGFLDVLFCNSQEHQEAPPVYIYSTIFGKVNKLEIPSEGSDSGTMADFNRDGYDDLVLASQDNGIRSDLNAFLYFGGPQGMSERYRLELPAPSATSVAAGDFNGDGAPDLAFVCHGKLRIFFQSELGLECKRFVDLEVEAEQVDAADLDRDGRADLYVLQKSGQPFVLWGGKDGINQSSRSSVLTSTKSMSFGSPNPTSNSKQSDAGVTLARIVRLETGPYLLMSGETQTLLIPVLRNRDFGKPVSFDCPKVLSAAVGDINGDGLSDLVLASRGVGPRGGQRSWIYWGNRNGFDRQNPTPLPTQQACDVAVADLNGDRIADVVICQDRTPESFTFHSLAFAGSAQGVSTKPVILESLDAQRVLIGKTSAAKSPDVVFVNHLARVSTGSVDAHIYYGGPTGFSADRGASLPGRGVVASVCADFNDDGRERDIDSFVYWGRPGGRFSSKDRTRLFAHSASGCIPGDFNEDGYVDLAVAYHKVDGDHLGYSAIWWNGPEGFSESRVTRLPTIGPHGMIVVNPGNQMNRGPEEYYSSAPFQLPEGAMPQKISWQAEVPPKTWVRAQLRVAATERELTHTSWQGREAGVWLENGDPIQDLRLTGRWIQYRLALGVKGSGQTPRVSEVRVKYGK